MSMNGDFLRDPKRFMRRNAVDPSENIMVHRRPAQLVGTRLFSKDTVARFFETGKGGVDSDAAMFAYEYSPILVRLGFDTVTGSAGGTKVRLNPVASGVHMYFLPWKSMAITHMTLPLHADARYFFTAALSGCSVFVAGTPQQPTIFHAGCSCAGKSDSATFWRQAMRILQAKTGVTDLNQAEVNKFDYRKGRDGGLTADSTAFQNTLLVHSGKVIASSGCVFGIKTGNAWSIYIQEHSIYRIRDVLQNKTRVQKKATSMREFFPAGNRTTNLITHVNA